MKRCAVVLMTVCVATFFAAKSADASDFQRASLKGVKGFTIVVETLPPEIEQRGVSVESIKTDVELRLRQSGVTVYANLDEDKNPAIASLYVNVNAIPGRGNTAGLFAF